MKMTGRVDPDTSRCRRKLNSGNPAKMNIQKKAIDLVPGVTLEKCLGGVKGADLKAMGIQQKSDGVECA